MFFLKSVQSGARITGAQGQHRSTSADTCAYSKILKYQVLTSPALSGTLKAHRTRYQLDVNGHRGLCISPCGCTQTLDTVPTRQRLLAVKGIFKKKTLPRMEVILFSVSSIRYEE